jgi:cytochrome c peroxidase
MRRLAFCLLLIACEEKAAPPPPPAAPIPPPRPLAWEAESPVGKLPEVLKGLQADFAKLAWVTPGKVRLGRWLFFDKRLSADGTVACASCHRPENAFSEPTPVSTGINGQKGGRKAPTFLNGAWPLFPVYFWDGRAASLMDQAKGPIANPIEMGNTHEKCVGAIAAVAGYRKAFKEVYGDEKIDIDRVAETISAYEATRLSGNSKFDRFDAGDQTALSDVEKKGRELFFGTAMCNQCHFGWNFTDSQFHNLGIGWDKKTRKFADEGRFKVSHKKEDLGAFKTPTLRDVSKHAPYMHDGSLPTLESVVQHYNHGGVANPNLSKKLFALKLKNDEVAAIIAFLKALDGEGYADKAPASLPQ